MPRWDPTGIRRQGLRSLATDLLFSRLPGHFTSMRRMWLQPAMASKLHAWKGLRAHRHRHGGHRRLEREGHSERSLLLLAGVWHLLTALPGSTAVPYAFILADNDWLILIAKLHQRALDGLKL
jgi:hypothetical protein